MRYWIGTGLALVVCALAFWVAVNDRYDGAWIRFLIAFAALLGVQVAGGVGRVRSIRGQATTDLRFWTIAALGGVGLSVLLLGLGVLLVISAMKH